MTSHLRSQVFWSSTTLIFYVIAIIIISLGTCAKRKLKSCDESEMPKREIMEMPKKEIREMPKKEIISSKLNLKISKEEKLPTRSKGSSTEQCSVGNKEVCNSMLKRIYEKVRKPPPIDERPKSPGRLVEQDDYSLRLQTLNLIKNEIASFE